MGAGRLRFKSPRRNFFLRGRRRVGLVLLAHAALADQQARCNQQQDRARHVVHRGTAATGLGIRLILGRVLHIAGQDALAQIRSQFQFAARRVAGQPGQHAVACSVGAVPFDVRRRHGEADGFDGLVPFRRLGLGQDVFAVIQAIEAERGLIGDRQSIDLLQLVLRQLLLQLELSARQRLALLMPDLPAGTFSSVQVTLPPLPSVAASLCTPPSLALTNST